MLRKVVSILLILIGISVLLYSHNEECEYNKKIDSIIEDDNLNRKYVGYVYIEKLEYKGLIKDGDYNEVLDSNLVLMISKKNLISAKYGNVILAGHNNKYVFSILYKLQLNDEIIISDFENEYVYKVSSFDYVNIKEKSILDNIYDDKILTLITCTLNNQIRYVVTAKYVHTISHN